MASPFFSRHQGFDETAMKLLKICCINCLILQQSSTRHIATKTEHLDVAEISSKVSSLLLLPFFRREQHIATAGLYLICAASDERC